VAFENILNGVWLLLGFIALIAIRARSTKSRSPVLCCIGVALVIATLFPIISASDDIIRIQHLERGHESQSQRSNSHKRTTDSLIRLYEAMESPLAVTPVRVCFVLFFAFLIVSLCNPDVRQRTIAQSGRSPPLCVG
jgi:hypothetical protein